MAGERLGDFDEAEAIRLRANYINAIDSSDETSAKVARMDATDHFKENIAAYKKAAKQDAINAGNTIESEIYLPTKNDLIYDDVLSFWNEHRNGPVSINTHILSLVNQNGHIVRVEGVCVVSGEPAVILEIEEASGTRRYWAIEANGGAIGAIGSVDPDQNAESVYIYELDPAYVVAEQQKHPGFIGEFEGLKELSPMILQLTRLDDDGLPTSPDFSGDASQIISYLHEAAARQKELTNT